MLDSFSAREKFKLWPWILVNSLAGQTVRRELHAMGARNTPTGIVYRHHRHNAHCSCCRWRAFLKGEKITARSLIGGLIAVVGVLGLTFGIESFGKTIFHRPRPPPRSVIELIETQDERELL